MTLYRPLFLLEADTAFIFEIKRLDVQSDNPGDVYFWLYFDKTTQKLHPLTFVSMKTEGEQQHREFTEGQLQFNASAGTYTSATAGSPLLLRLMVPPILPAAVETALLTFFDAPEATL